MYECENRTAGHTHREEEPVAVVQALPSPTCAESVVLLGKQAWLLLFLASVWLSFSSAFPSSTHFQFSKSFIAAQSQWILKWHLMLFEILPSPFPPPLASKWNKMAGCSPAVPLRDVTASFWALEGLNGW